MGAIGSQRDSGASNSLGDRELSDLVQQHLEQIRFLDELGWPGLDKRFRKASSTPATEPPHPHETRSPSSPRGRARKGSPRAQFKLLTGRFERSRQSYMVAVQAEADAQLNLVSARGRAEEARRKADAARFRAGTPLPQLETETRLLLAELRRAEEAHRQWRNEIQRTSGLARHWQHEKRRQASHLSVLGNEIRALVKDARMGSRKRGEFGP